MGAWGVGHFDNDHACDFAQDVVDAGGAELVDDAIRAVHEVGGDPLDAPVAEEALVAAEVVARWRGRFGVRNAYTEELDRWIAEHPRVPTPAQLAEAGKAVERILTAPSELLDLWSDTEELEAWTREVLDLRARLQ